jgi:DNA-binding response OmpR family regulator
MSDQSRNVLSFGPFELSIRNRLLTRGSTVLPLGARAMDLLVTLVEQANKVVCLGRTRRRSGQPSRAHFGAAQGAGAG